MGPSLRKTIKFSDKLFYGNNAWLKINLKFILNNGAQTWIKMTTDNNQNFKSQFLETNSII